MFRRNRPRNQTRPRPRRAHAAAKPGPQAAEFARLLAQFKKLEADAGTIKLKYPTADAAQRPALRKEFDDLMAKMEVLLGQLVAAAEKAYIEAPNADREVTGLLCTMLEQWVQQDNDEDAYALGKLLLDHHCTIPQVADLAGTAAFAVGEPDAAEKYLQLAAKGGGLSKQGQRDPRWPAGDPAGVGEGEADPPGRGQGR